MDPLLALVLVMGFGSSIVAAYGLGRLAGINHAERVLRRVAVDLEDDSHDPEYGTAGELVKTYFSGGRDYLEVALGRLDQ